MPKPTPKPKSKPNSQARAKGKGKGKGKTKLNKNADAAKSVAEAALQEKASRDAKQAQQVAEAKANTQFAVEEVVELWVDSETAWADAVVRSIDQAGKNAQLVTCRRVSLQADGANVSGNGDGGGYQNTTTFARSPIIRKKGTGAHTKDIDLAKVLSVGQGCELWSDTSGKWVRCVGRLDVQKQK